MNDQRYALIREDGTALGFLSAFINDIPPEAIPITDAQWVEWQANPSTRRWTGTALETVQEPEPPAAIIEPPSVESLMVRAQALQAEMDSVLRQLQGRAD